MESEQKRLLYEALMQMPTNEALQQSLFKQDRIDEASSKKPEDYVPRGVRRTMEKALKLQGLSQGQTLDRIRKQGLRMKMHAMREIEKD